MSDWVDQVYTDLLASQLPMNTETDGNIIGQCMTTMDEAVNSENHEYDWWKRPDNDAGQIDICDLDNMAVSHPSMHAVCNQLICSHLHMAIGAAWKIKRNIVVWIDCPMELVEDHPETIKGYVQRFCCNGKIATRSYRVTSLGNKTFGLAPAMNRFQLRPSPVWNTIGLVYKEGRLPKIHLERRVRWLEVDYRQTLMPSMRFPVLSLIDKDFRKSLLPASNSLIVNVILHVFNREEAMEMFPDLFLDKTWEDYMKDMKESAARDAPSQDTLTQEVAEFVKTQGKDVIITALPDKSE